ncbi:MAG: shikimate dehydrogenase [Flavobacteriaceae bacterium]|nr:shikimate dehydrogenase [Flavobacteriaceae bacterium]
MKCKFGLLGKNIAYSFSKKHFTEKFRLENLSCIYENFDIDNMEKLPAFLKSIKNLKGFNVTIPYKESIFKYLDEIDVTAVKIGAVNTVKVINKIYLKGYNTDYYGFINSLKPLLEKQHKTAIILGNGGATKAVKYALTKLNIDFIVVSRNCQDENTISYTSLTKKHFENSIIINCTPLGTYPKIEECPNIPYQFINSNNLLYDLVYNPLESLFLKKGKENKSKIKNGLEMLALQAEKSWNIWKEIS